MKTKVKSKRRLIAEPLESRLLFSATVDFALLDDGHSDLDNLVTLAAQTDLTAIYNLDDPELFAPRLEFSGELIFVDSRIDDYQTLINDIINNTDDRNIEIITLDANEDGVLAITGILAQYSNVQAVHLLSHGSEGKVHLGAARLDQSNLAAYNNALSSWNQALSENADLLIYGCNLAANNGESFIQNLAQITGADVAASDDATGSAEFNGDWELESQQGSIETYALFYNSDLQWHGVLAGATPTATDDTTTIWQSETVTGNVIDGTGGSNVNADALNGEGPGSLVSVTYNATLYDSFDANGNLSITTASGSLVTFNQDGTYTYATSYVSVTENVDLNNWSDNFGYHGYANTSYLDGGKITINSLASYNSTVYATPSGLGIGGDYYIDVPLLSSSDALVLDLNDTYSYFSIDTTHLTILESLDWTAYDATGTQIATGSVTGTGILGSASEHTIASVDVSGDFQYLAFEVGSLTGNYRLYGLTVASSNTPANEQFTYVIQDADNDTDTGLLNINYSDDNIAPTGGGFTGTATEDQTLTASAVADGDGISGATSYQWQRSANGTTGWADISGETSNTYILDDPDVGKYVRLITSFTDDQGTMESITSAASSAISGINDTPTLGNNTLTINEGESVVLTSANISAIDPDDADSALTFTVSNVTHGQFQLVADNSVVTSFTQSDITNGAIKFVHDGGEIAPSFDISVADDEPAATSAAAASITFSANVNDTPTANNDAFTIWYDETVSGNLIDGSGGTNLVADTLNGEGPGSLVSVEYNSTVYNTWDGSGNLSISTASGSTLIVNQDGSYTYTTGYNATTGNVEQENWETVFDLYGYEIGNSFLNGGIIDATSLANANAEPVYQSSAGLGLRNVTNSTSDSIDASASGSEAIVIDLGASSAARHIDITTSALATTENARVSFYNTSGILESTNIFAGLGTGNSDDYEVNSFLASADIRYLVFEVDGTSGGYRLFDLTVADTEPAGEVFTYVMQDNNGDQDSGTLSVAYTDDNNSPLPTFSGTLNEGDTLTADAIADADGVSGTVTYQWQHSLSSTRGWSDITGATGSSYVLGGVAVDSYIRYIATYTDDEGTLEVVSSAPSSSKIIGTNDVPLLGNNSLTITEGATVNINGANFSATDVDDYDPSLIFTVSNVNYGEFQLVSDNSTVTSFTQAQVTAGNVIKFVHDGSGNAASYDVSVADEGGAATTPVAASISFTTVNDGSGVTLSGTEAENQTLTATITDPDTGTPTSASYVWQRSTDGGSNWSTISGATSSTYTLVDADSTNLVRVVAAYTDGEGNAESNVIATSGVIASVNDGSGVTLSGTEAENQTLTATINDPDAGTPSAISYVWQRSTDGGSNWSTISGATSSTYTLVDADSTNLVRVVAAYTDGEGNAESNVIATSGVIASVNDGSGVTLSGAEAENQTLTATINDPDAGTPTSISYVWQRSTDGGSNWSTISGATSNTYTLVDTDSNNLVRVVAAYTDGEGNAESNVIATSGVIASVNDGSGVTLSGTEAENQTLTATINDPDAGTPTSISYVWQRSTDGGSNWSTISGATSSTYTLGDADSNNLVRVVAAYTDGEGNAESNVIATSGVIASVNDGSGVTLSGTEAENQTLTATINDPDAGTPSAISYVWQRSTDGGSNWSTISGATSNTYTLVDTDSNNLVRVVAAYTDGEGNAESNVVATSGVIASVNDGNGVTLSGTEAENQTLTATINDPDAGTPSAISYVWQRSTDGGSNWSTISGATGSTYTLVDADSTNLVRVVAAYTDGEGNAESNVIATSGVIASVNDGNGVTLSGTEAENQTLTATINDPDAGTPTSISYIWQRSTDGGSNWSTISGATSSTYTLVDADSNNLVRVVAAYTDGEGNAESNVIATSGVIASVNDGSGVTLSGTEAENQTLTATINDPDAGTPTSASYVWQRSTDGGSNWSTISGATSSTYTLVDADSTNLVRVVAAYTDGEGNAESNVIATSGVIASVNDGSGVTLSGTEAENQTLTATINDPDAGTPNSISYVWQRSTDGGSNWSTISGATSSTYTLVDADSNNLVRVIAAYTDGEGNAESNVIATSGVIASVNDGSGVTLSGTEAENQTLTATINDPDAGTPTSISYVWQRSTDGGSNWSTISGATSSTYTLVDADSTNLVRVVADYTDGEGNAESNVIATSGVIASVNDGNGVTLSGTEAENQTLTATINDPDAGTPTSASYVWQRSTDGGSNWSTISGATSSTYTLVDADSNNLVRVVAAYTDGEGNAESNVIATSGMIASVNDGNGVTLSGTEAENQTLTATINDPDAGTPSAISYVWQRSTDGGSNWATISGATSSTYTLVDADSNNLVRVVAAYTDGEGNAESNVIAISGVIASVNDGSGVTLSGTEAENQTLTATINDPDAGTPTSASYVWQRSTDGGSNWSTISGATSSTYTLVDADSTNLVRVVAAYTDGEGNAESNVVATSGVIASVNDGNGVTLSGTEAENQTLTATINDPDAGTPTSISYIWQRSTDGGSNWSTISGATGSTYTLVDADSTNLVRVVAAYTDGEGNAESNVIATSGVIASVNDGNGVTLSGTEAENQTLTATINDPDAGTPTSASYVWQRSTDGGSNWSTISGATSNTYTLVDADSNNLVRVVAAYTDGEGNAESNVIATSGVIASVNDGNGVTLSGTEAENQTLTATINDPDAGTPTSASYVWQRSTDGGSNWSTISGATSSTYTLVDADSNNLVRVVAAYTDGEGNAESNVIATSGVIASVNDGSGVTLSGTEAENQTLTATINDPDAGTPTSASYIWQRSTDGGSNWSTISGATSSTYTLVDADSNNLVRVVAAYTDGEGNAESNVIATSGVIASVNDGNGVTLSGTEAENQTLTATINDPDAGTPTGISYIWQRSTDGGSNWSTISGATSSTYTLVDADSNNLVRVVAAYTDGEGNAESNVIASSGVIASVNDGSGVTLSGTEAENQTLTATINDPDAGTPTSISYVWQRSTDGVSNWSTISGATSSTYTLVDADSNNLVRVVAAYTDGEGNAESNVIATSGVIASVNDGNGVTLSGTEAENQTLTATINDPDAGTPSAISYVWQRSTDGGSNWSTISGATGSTYTLVDTDSNNLVRVVAAYTDGEGNTESNVIATSGVIASVNDGSGVTLSGTEAENQTLTATINDPDAGTPTSASYVWQRSTDGGSNWSTISGTTSSTYTLVDADSNNLVRVIAAYTDGEGNAESNVIATSGVITSVNDGSGVTLSGTEAENQTLTATINDPDAGTPTSISYIWQRSTDGGSNWSTISGATSSTYTLVDADSTNLVRVVAAYTDGEGNAESNVIATSGVIASVNDGSGVTLSGTEAENQTLTATINDPDAGTPTSISYIWQRSTDGGSNWSTISGATSSTYTLVDADSNNLVRVVAAYTDGEGNAESNVIATSGVIASVNDGSGVTLSGTEAENQTLTATINDPDAGTPTSASYVWQRSTDGGSNWSTISGATSSTYTLVDADSTNLVRVVAAYTDGEGNAESNVIATSGVIASVNDGSGVTLSGTEAENQTLTATINDPDAGTPTSISYVWQRSTDGGSNWSTISGTTSSTYTLVDADSNNLVRVVAAYTDGEGNAESNVIATSGVITSVNDGSGVTLSGTEAENQTLTATINDPDAGTPTSISYIWQRSTDGGSNWSTISGATSSTYTLVDADSTNLVRVVAAYTDGEGNAESNVIATSGVIASVNDGSGVTLSGTEAENQTLTATINDPDAGTPTSASYVWQRSTDGGSNWSTISGATSSTYTLVDADSNNLVRVVAAYTDGEGNTESNVIATSGVIASVNDGSGVTLSGTEAENQTLTATINDPDAGTPTSISHVWQRSTDGGSNWSTISGATSSTYTLVDADSNNLVRVVAAYTDGEGNGESNVIATSGVIASVNDGNGVTLSGTEAENQTLTATINDPDAGTPTSISYLWQRSTDGGSNWSTISGATSSTYTLVDADSTNLVRVIAAYTDGEGNAESNVIATSGVIASVNDGSGVTLSGTEAENQTLTATINDPDAGTPTSISYVWQRSTDGGSNWSTISGATSSTYTLVDADSTNLVRVVAAYTDGEGNAESNVIATSGVIASVNDGNGVTLSGTEAENQTLTATINDPDAGTPTSISYVWQRSTDGGSNWSTISGATSSTYTLVDADSNNLVRVVAAYTDGEGNAESNVIATSGVITNVNDTPTLVNNSLTINEGQALILTASNISASDVDDDDASLIFTASNISNAVFQLVADGTSVTSFTQAQINAGEIQFVHDGSENAPSFDLTVADDDFASSITAASNITFNTVNDDGNVSITGTATEDQTLLAMVTDADGLSGSLSYQWQRSDDGILWNDIVGATAANFSLGDGDIGRFVRVTTSYTDDLGTYEALTSAATGAILNINDPALLNFTGVEMVTQLLAATLIDNDGASGPISYQWQRSADGNNWTAITGATNAAYMLDFNDVGQYVRATVAYTDDQGTLESVATTASGLITANNASATLVLTGSPVEDQVLSATAADADGIGSDISYQWQRSSDGITWLDIAGANTLSYTLGDNDVGQLVRVAASFVDNLALLENPISAATGPVGNINDAPIVMVAIANQTATEDSTFSFAFGANTFFDADNDNLTYTAQVSGGGSLPSWLTFDGNTRTFSGTPDQADTGVVALDVIASDGQGGSVIAQFSTSITAVNDAPIANAIATIDASEDGQSNVIDLFSYFSDEEQEANTLNYELVNNTNANLFSQVSFDDANGQLLLDYEANQFGTAVITYRATDNSGAFAETSVTVNISAVNDAPISAGNTSVSMLEGSQSSGAFDLSTMFNDIEDGTHLVYSVVDNSNPNLTQVIAIDSTTGQLSLSFAPEQIGSSTLILRATDSQGATVDSELTVTIKAKPIITQPTGPSEPPSEDTPPVAEEPAESAAPKEKDPEAETPRSEDLPSSPETNQPAINIELGSLSFGPLNQVSEPVLIIEPIVDSFVSDNAPEDKQRFIDGQKTLEKNGASATNLANLIATSTSFLSEQDVMDFNLELKRLRLEMDEAVEEEQLEKAFYNGITLSITTGLVVWALRAGSFFLTLFSMLPIWKGLDPLPVISLDKRKKETKQQQDDKKEEDKRRDQVGYLFDNDRKLKD